MVLLHLSCCHAEASNSDQWRLAVLWRIYRGAWSLPMPRERAINPANCGLMAQDYQIRVPLKEPSTIPECAPMIHPCNILSQSQLTTIMTSLILTSSTIYFALLALFSVMSLKEPIYWLPGEAVTSRSLDCASKRKKLSEKQCLYQPRNLKLKAWDSLRPIKRTELAASLGRYCKAFDKISKLKLFTTTRSRMSGI